MSSSQLLTSLWPAAGLRVSSGELELRWIDDELLVILARLAAKGIHEPDRMPFGVPWTRGSGQDVARSVLRYQWAARAEIGPAKLALELAVLHRGRPVGIQAAGGANWSVLRTVETGSWLGREYQGQGLGARMRALMLHLLFDGLGARQVNSTAFADNPASNRVSLKTGYLQDGHVEVVREGQAAVLNRYRMSAERFESQRQGLGHLLGAPVHLEGIPALRAQLETDGA